MIGAGDVYAQLFGPPRRTLSPTRDGASAPSLRPEVLHG